MVAAFDIATRLSLARTKDMVRLVTLLERCSLPVTAPGVRAQKVFDAQLHDKKFASGKNRFVLPLAIGKVKVVKNVPVNIVKDAIEKVVG
jgi:3-dehydroquinate synthetase